jgi:hypothetical protein
MRPNQALVASWMTQRQDAINKRMKGGDQTAATKAAMAEAKVAN